MGETAAEVGARLRVWRERAGNPSFSTIERQLVMRLGPTTAPRAETIRTYHAGRGPDPAIMNLELIECLADIYGCAVSELSVTVAERLGRLLVGNRRAGVVTGDADGAVTAGYTNAAAA